MQSLGSLLSPSPVLHRRERLQLRAVAFWTGQQCGWGDQKGRGVLSGLGAYFIFPHCVMDPPPAPLEDRPWITQPSPFAWEVGCFYKHGINAARELFPFPFSSPIPPSLKHPPAQPSSGAAGLGRGLRPSSDPPTPGAASLLSSSPVSQCSQVPITGCAGLKPQQAEEALV